MFGKQCWTACAHTFGNTGVNFCIAPTELKIFRAVVVHDRLITVLIWDVERTV